MENNREKELGENIIRCMASMAIFDISIEIILLQKIVDKAQKELNAIESAKTKRLVRTE